MAEIVFKTIWQSDEMSQLQKGSQEHTRSRGDMAEASLEHEKKEKKWLFTKKKKSVSFHGTECNKAVDDVQLSCPELRRSAASTNVSTLNLSCEKDSTDSSGSWDIRKMNAPLATTEDVRGMWSIRPLSGSPCVNFLESIERSKNAANVLKECTRKLQKKSKEVDQHMAEVENNIARQKSLTIEEKLMNLCQRIKRDHMQWRERLVRDDDPGPAGIGSPLAPAGPQVQAIDQIARSMGDLRQALAARLSGAKEADSQAGAGTDAGREGRVPNATATGSLGRVPNNTAAGNKGQEPNNTAAGTGTGSFGHVSNTAGNEGQEPNTTELPTERVRGSVGSGLSRHQSQSWLRQDELRTLSQFQGRFEELQLQWERTHKEHQRTARMLHDLKSEIDTIAHTSKMLFSAFDQIQKNVCNLNHLKPLIENIQNLLETNRSQRNTEPGYLSSLDQSSVQGEALQHLVDQAVLPLVAKIRMCHLTFTCNQCCRKCKLSVP
ncbi:testis-specific serine kinase substrate [Amblyraja radiata]|uniref:testis-specific serine kinase substrate n=1 Tax=Amblyraja radiata TaxID=386614 RepID=UPI0014030FE1|nr:testis-specific serine kinase substrate [Amblyraja radiata]